MNTEKAKKMERLSWMLKRLSRRKEQKLTVCCICLIYNFILGKT